VFATAPVERKGRLLEAADAYSRKEPASIVLAKLDGLDPTEPNTAFMRGLGTLGLGGRPNAEAGLALLRAGADARHTGAMALYGLAKINPPAMIDKEPAEGRAWLQRAVDAGDGQAAYLLGHAYLSGWAGIIDPAKSVGLFRLAADAGHVDAMKVLGTLAMLGQGMPRDYVESETQLRRAAMHGDSEAQAALGMYLAAANVGGWERSFDEAVHWLTKAAGAGQPKAMNWLGMIHLEYAQGTPLHSIEKGLDWMRRCAALREKDCHYALGHAYETGTGVAADWVRAAAHYQNARSPGPEGAKAKEAHERIMAGLSESEKSKVNMLQAELYRGDERSFSALGLKVGPIDTSAKIGSFSSLKAPHD
jgi:TPR repeat protein